MLWNRAHRLAIALGGALLLAAIAPAARAADPYEINAILSVTGAASFIGATQQEALKAVEGYVNRTGGIDGRPLSFVVADDQSQPQVALQLAQGLIAKHVPVILGPSIGATCHAISPLVLQDGPVLYCLTTFLHPTEGSFIFATLPSAEAQEAAMLRYFRERGLHRIAYIVTTDASGQEAENAILSAAAEPEDKSVQIVAREHFGAADISIAAQLALIKAAKPDALFAWATGTAAGTLFQAAQEAGIDLPTATSGADLNPIFFKQYGSLLPTNLYFSGLPFYAADTLSDRATKAALATMSSALDAIGAKPDQVKISAWDPATIIVDGLRKIGPSASAAQLRDYIVNLRGWVGANGPYDFRADPQRGVGVGSVIVVKWDARRSAVVSVSKPGGMPLGGK